MKIATRRSATSLATDELVRAQACVTMGKGAGGILAVIDKVLGGLLSLALSDRRAGFVGGQCDARDLADHVGDASTASLEAAALDSQPLLELRLIRLLWRAGDVAR